MEQRDFLQDQIDQLGKVLAKLLADFVGFKSQGNVAEGIKHTNKVFAKALDLDVEVLLAMGNNELWVYLRRKKYQSEHLELIADYFTEWGESLINENEAEAVRIFRKAMQIYDLINEDSRVYSFERAAKYQKLEAFVEELQ